jgi:predicted methyltransferase
MPPSLALIQRAVARSMKLRTRDKPEHGAYHVDAASMRKRLACIVRYVDPSSRVLCVGDDDLTSMCLHFLGYRQVTVVDFDLELLDVIERASAGTVRVVSFDLRAVYQSHFPKLRSDFDFFVTDPPYGKDGLRVFAGVGLAALRRGGAGIVVMPSQRVRGSSVGDPLELCRMLQSFLTANGAAAVEIQPDAQHSYHGTVSSLLVLRKTGRAPVRFTSLDGPRSFY